MVACDCTDPFNYIPMIQMYVSETAHLHISKPLPLVE